MNEYKLSPAFYTQLRRRVGIPSAVLCLLAAFGGILIASRGNFDSTTLIIIPVVMIILIVSLARILRSVERVWASYRLILEDNSIMKVQVGLADLKIMDNELSRIIEAPNRGISLIASNPARTIFIPNTLEGYPELRQELLKWHPIVTISKAREKWIPIYPIALGLLAILAFVLTFLSTNTIVVIVAGTFLFIDSLASFVVIQRSPQFTKKVKLSSWFSIFMLLLIAARIYLIIQYSHQ